MFSLQSIVNYKIDFIPIKNIGLGLLIFVIVHVAYFMEVVRLKIEQDRRRSGY